jgi:predicted GNAT family acetyltransferase
VVPEITVTREMRDERHGRYVARIAGVDAEAELTFTRRGEHVVSADHTGAPPVLRGTGAAMALVERLISDARGEGFRIVPICPYLRAQYERHPEWGDVMTVAPGEMPVISPSHFG